MSSTRRKIGPLNVSYDPNRGNPLKVAVESGRMALAAMGRGTYPGASLDKKVLPEVLSAGVWDAKRPQNWSVIPHRNEGVELSCLLRGSLEFKVNDKTHNMTEGVVTATRPWQVHALGSPDISPSCERRCKSRPL